MERVRGRRWLSAGVLAAIMAASPVTGVAARTISILGVPHMRELAPLPAPAQATIAVEALSHFRPTLICIEAMPGERVETLVQDPGRFGELLRGFALDAVRLAPEQQIRLGLTAAEARAESLRASSSQSDVAARLRLISLQLASYEPWSALLNWTYLDPDERTRAAQTLGAAAARRLEQMSTSDNEIAVLAIPLARRFGHARLCAADPFADELAVQSIAAELGPLVARPEVQAGIEQLNEQTARRWQSDGAEALLEMLRWLNGADYEALDRGVQWSIFDTELDRDAGRRRLMAWHARNADIAAFLFRALAHADGERVLMIIGSAHRPFLEEAMRAQPWLNLVPSETILAR